MMAADDNDGMVDEANPVPFHVVEPINSPVSAKLGGWATGAGSAIFAVTKGVSSTVQGTVQGVSSRVEGVSSRMSLRAKDMLSSISDEADGRGSGASAVDESEAFHAASILGEAKQLADKVVAMNKLSNVLGNGAVKGSQSVLHCAAVPLAASLLDAEHFEPFFANACIGCAHQILEAQGGLFATELVESGAAEALIPLLHPKFELIRIEGLALLEALLLAERVSVCSRVVGVPTGMQALVDLLDDRWDEVRHQALSVLATFLEGGSGVPPPVDLQNFVAFQEGFDKLFKAAEESSEATSLLALTALAGALANNPLSQKLFVAGGHLARIPALLAVLRPGDISYPSPVQPLPPAAIARRRWGWGRGGGGGRAAEGRDTNGGVVAAAAAAAAARDVTGLEGYEHAAANGGGGAVSLMSPSSAPSSSNSATPPPPPASSQAAVAPVSAGGAGAGARGPGAEEEVPVARIRVALSLVSALVGGGCPRAPVAAATNGVCRDSAEGWFGVEEGAGEEEEEDTGVMVTETAGDGVRGAVGRESGLLEAVCELALASSRAPAGGGPTWAEYGLPEDCQRAAMGVLTALVKGHAGNQACLVRCDVRGAPMAVTVHGRKELISAEPRNVVDGLLELWLAASLDVAEGDGVARGDDGGDANVELTLLDRLLNGFILGNTSWCLSVLKGVSSLHASAAKGGDVMAMSPPAGGDPALRSITDERRQKEGVAVGTGESSVGGVAGMSSVVSKGLLALDPTTMKGSLARSGATLHTREDEDGPTTAALSVHLLRRVLQAGGADARSIAAGIGVATEGAGRRREAADKQRDDPDMVMMIGMDGDRNGGGGQDDGDTRGGGGRGEGEWGGPGGGEGWRGGGRGGGGGVRCGPPLTPALEVAVRLLADGYNVAVKLQTGAMEAEDDGSSSPPRDLTRYLVALGELLVTWLSPPGAGPALSRRLLASGGNWALLRTLGRTVGRASCGARASGAKKRRAAPGWADNSTFAYLHALVAVVVGSFLSSAERLTRRTLSAGIAKHVGLFEFCRALDAASDWIAFAKQTPKGERTKKCRRGSVPAVWALEGDSDFTGGMASIIHAAQSSIIQIIAGVNEGVNRGKIPDPHASNGDASQGGFHAEENWDSWSTEQEGQSDEVDDLLRRQETRIQELEQRLHDSVDSQNGSAGGGRSPTIKTITI